MPHIPRSSLPSRPARAAFDRRRLNAIARGSQRHNTRGLFITTVLIGANGQLDNELRQAFSDQDLVPLTHGDFELTNPWGRGQEKSSFFHQHFRGTSVTTLLIGADGQLGSELWQAFSDQDVAPLTHADIELTDQAQVREILRTYRPSLILNTAAYHRVDECEDFPERAFAVNAIAVRNLAIASKEIGATLVHFSTDYVFDGRQRSPYREVDRPGPLSVYAGSKLAGEYFVQVILERHYLIRTCGLYGLAGSRSKMGNFVETMLRLAADGREIKIVGDQIVTPTSAKELAHKVRQLVESDAYGLYHITNNGECSWYQFAKAAFEFSGVQANLCETTSAAYGARATRPAYSVLDNANLRSLGLDDLSDWRDALEAYLKDRALGGSSSTTVAPNAGQSCR